jgi:hypothetical protein
MRIERKELLWKTMREPLSMLQVHRRHHGVGQEGEALVFELR